MPMVHRCLCRLPAYLGIDNIDYVIKESYDLYQQHPPTSLRTEVRKYLKERYEALKKNKYQFRMHKIINNSQVKG